MICALLALAQSAHAAYIRPLSLTELFRRAELVVKVKEAGCTIVAKSYLQVCTVTVLKVYKGRPQQQRLLVAHSTLYRPHLADDQPYTHVVKGKQVLYTPRPLAFDYAVMFLKWDGSKKRYRPVMTGIKRVLKDKVFRYKQYSNPGPLVLFPQTAENLPQTFKGPYTPSAFARDLALAKDRSR